MFKYTQAVIKQALPAYRSLSTYKTSTGLVGLAVDVNGRDTLLDLSTKIMEAVKPIPASSQYRINVEKWFTFIPKGMSLQLFSSSQILYPSINAFNSLTNCFSLAFSCV